MNDSSASRLTTGLVSISFRKYSPRQIVELAGASGLQSIEWGGDIHVPHGDAPIAREVRTMSNDAGIAISAYGSYYRAGATPDKTPAFDAVLDAAIALGAPSIRVWAGIVGSADADEETRHRIETDLRRIASLAESQNIRIALEYHGGTLTDTPSAALKLLHAVDHPNLRTYWQPRHGLTIEENLSDIAMLSPYLDNIHVFHWWPDNTNRLPLADGKDRWFAYTQAIQHLGGSHVLSLEFIRDDDPTQLSTDAAVLRSLVASVRVGT